MARIHLFMCSFLVSFVLSSSTSTTVPLSPSASVMVTASGLTPSAIPSDASPSAMVVDSSTIQATIPSDASPSAMVVDSSTIQATIQSDASPSAMVVDSSTIQATPSSSVNVTLSSSVAPGQPTTKKFQARMTVNETYDPDFSNSSSAEFETFASTFKLRVGEYLDEVLVGFVDVVVNSLLNGSVVVDFDILVLNSSNATVDSIVQALNDGNGGRLRYTFLGNVIVKDQQSSPSTLSPTATITVPRSTSTTPVPPTSSTKATEIWDKAIELATPLGTFIIVVVAVALILILLIALICVCCKYAKLKKEIRYPSHMAIQDSEWIRSSDDLLMWERNLRASEVKTTNGVSTRPVNDKRT